MLSLSTFYLGKPGCLRAKAIGNKMGFSFPVIFYVYIPHELIPGLELPSFVPAFCTFGSYTQSIQAALNTSHFNKVQCSDCLGVATSFRWSFHPRNTDGLQHSYSAPLLSSSPHARSPRLALPSVGRSKITSLSYTDLHAPAWKGSAPWIQALQLPTTRRAGQSARQ